MFESAGIKGLECGQGKLICFLISVKLEIEKCLVIGNVHGRKDFAQHLLKLDHWRQFFGLVLPQQWIESEIHRPFEIANLGLAALKGIHL